MWPFKKKSPQPAPPKRFESNIWFLVCGRDDKVRWKTDEPISDEDQAKIMASSPLAPFHLKGSDWTREAWLAPDRVTYAIFNKTVTD